jgi:outer membrane protein assembly factor BamB
MARGSREGRGDSLSGLATAPAVVWRVRLGGAIVATPVVALGNVAFVGTEAGVMHSIGQDGVPRWRSTVGGGIRTSAALTTDGTVYFGGEDGRLHALSAKGERVWTYDVPGLRPVRSSPAIAPDGSIVFGADDGKIRSVAADGRLRWEVPTGAPVRSPVAIAPTGVAVVGNDAGEVLAIAGDGSVRWRLATAGPIRGSASIATAEPAPGSQSFPTGRALLTDAAGRLRSVELAGGRVVWTAEGGAGAGDCSSIVSLRRGKAYSRGGTGGAARVDLITGLMQPVSGTAPGGICLGLVDRRGTVVDVTTVGVLRGIPEEGAPWSVRVAPGALTSPALGSGGTLYVGTAGGELVALRVPRTWLAQRCQAELGGQCACACTACLGPASACLDDAACRAVADCAEATGCRGDRCLREPRCQSAIAAAGGPASYSMSLAGVLGACVTGSCSDCGGAP